MKKTTITINESTEKVWLVKIEIKDGRFTRQNCDIRLFNYEENAIRFMRNEISRIEKNIRNDSRYCSIYSNCNYVTNTDGKYDMTFFVNCDGEEWVRVEGHIYCEYVY